MTNYEVYFGTQERALDSLTLLLKFLDHPRQEVREFQNEVKQMGSARWLKSECTEKGGGKINHLQEVGNTQY